ncbi:MAG: hypothetical protein NTZ83_00820, partial [Candidatus Pacearchaeota archaeon]|nr:hypothetical protein [Candidatus Pacearchaeota archaeon]
VFVGMDKKLEKAVKKDVSEFKLFISQNNGVSVDKPQEYGNLIVLNCSGYIANFEFPEGSDKNKFERREQKRNGTEIEISFNYHNRLYKISGHV